MTHCVNPLFSLTYQEKENEVAMLCPVCKTDLLMTDRQGVEIDYCPKCRGVWLDRGELDKIIERSGVESGPSYEQQAPPPPPPQQQQYREPYRKDDGYYRDGYKDSDYYKKKKRKDFFSDLFDF